MWTKYNISFIVFHSKCRPEKEDPLTYVTNGLACQSNKVEWIEWDFGRYYYPLTRDKKREKNKSRQIHFYNAIMSSDEKFLCQNHYDRTSCPAYPPASTQIPQQLKREQLNVLLVPDHRLILLLVRKTGVHRILIWDIELKAKNIGIFIYLNFYPTELWISKHTDFAVEKLTFPCS